MENKVFKIFSESFQQTRPQWLKNQALKSVKQYHTSCGKNKTERKKRQKTLQKQVFRVRISECHKVSNSVTVVENSHFCQKLLDLFIFYLKKVNFPKDRTCKILSGCGKPIICQQFTRKRTNSFQDFQDPRKACILKLFATFPHFPQVLIIIILLNIFIYIYVCVLSLSKAKTKKVRGIFQIEMNSVCCPRCYPSS